MSGMTVIDEYSMRNLLNNVAILAYDKCTQSVRSCCCCCTTAIASFRLYWL